MEEEWGVSRVYDSVTAASHSKLGVHISGRGMRLFDAGSVINLPMTNECALHKDATQYDKTLSSDTDNLQSLDSLLNTDHCTTTHP